MLVTDEGRIVPERSGRELTFFRVDSRAARKALRPGDAYVVNISYYVDERLFTERRDVFERAVAARVLVDGEIVAETCRPMRELENF